MRSCVLFLFLAASLPLFAQDTQAPANPPSNSQSKDSNSGPQQNDENRKPDLAAPRSDRVNVDQLGDEPGTSSSKDTEIDLSPPEADVKAHPENSSVLKDEGGAPGGTGGGDVAEFHPWDPHKAAKDVEVGDFYFKRKNYRAAEDRYREALYYKNNDAIATYHLAICLEKLNRPDDAVKEYESYLNILPNGAEAEACHKAIARLKPPTPGPQAKQ
jgi:tetratricopeptide (TPR) repeat protein